MSAFAHLACLSEGTHVSLAVGRTLIEDIEIGDFVETLDHGLQPVRAIIARTLSGVEYQSDRRLWPVSVRQGALGFGLPLHDLVMSPQNRILFRHIRIPLMFGEDAVFVKAKSLCAAFGQIAVDGQRRAVTYYGLVFDRPEIILAEGTPVESLEPDPAALAALDAQSRTDILAVRPDLAATERSDQDDYLTLKSWELMSAVG